MTGDSARALEAIRLLSERDRRYTLFPAEIFDEFAWNMLLHLFVAFERGQAMSEAELCRLAHAGEAVGRRWLQHLVADGQIEARQHGDDVILTGSAISRLRMYLKPAGDLREGDATARP